MDIIVLVVRSWAENQVGEWEVRHALRQSEDELRGKDLASRERIEELLVTVRREPAATIDNCCATSPERRREDVVDPDDFPHGASLNAFFSLTGDEDGARSDIGEDSSADSSVKVDLSLGATLASSRGRNSTQAQRGKHVDAEGRGGKTPQQHAGGGLLGNKRTPSARKSAERDRVSPRTKQTEPAMSTTAGAGSSSSAPVPRPKLLRKKKPATIVPPDLAALFRAPLLVPRHLDPPIAGSAAAAVMAAGGARRVKPGQAMPSSGNNDDEG